MATPGYRFERFPYKTRYTVLEKLAIGFEYDEQTSSRLSALEWDEYHCSWTPEYCFAGDDRRDDETGAWTVDCDDEALDVLREEVGIDVPLLGEIPLNLHPFRGAPSDENPNFRLKDGHYSTFMAVLTQSSIPARRLTHLAANSEAKIPVVDSLERECPSCGKAGIMSEKEVGLVYHFSSTPQKVLRESPATHFCDKCDALFVWPPSDDSSLMGKAMGG